MSLMELQLPTQYVVDREIARGGIGTVYEARQIGVDGFEKRVALKLLREDCSHDQEFNDGLIAESKLVADLVHENIVQVYQLGKASTRYYVAMELIEGITFRAFIERHLQKGIRVPIELTAFIVSRVCRALEYAHARRGRDGHALGIVHRDICPNNVMINFLGVVKLGDFGIAKAKGFAPDLEGEVLLGKVRYMSPEQAAFLKTDHRSDIFSLAVVMHEALAGMPLFLDTNTQRIMENVQNREIPSLRSIRPDMPEALDAVLMRALERDPDARYQDASEMLYALEYFLYNDRFGPTNNQLRDYIADLFPEAKLARRDGSSRAPGRGAPALAKDDKTTPIANPDRRP